jgi:hypothetical protein
MYIVLIIIGIASSVFMLYCYETAQLIDESFKPLEPIKTFKDTEITKVVIYVIIFMLVVWLVSSILYPTCTLDLR